MGRGGSSSRYKHGGRPWPSPALRAACTAGALHMAATDPAGSTARLASTDHFSSSTETTHPQFSGVLVIIKISSLFSMATQAKICAYACACTEHVCTRQSHFQAVWFNQPQNSRNQFATSGGAGSPKPRLPCAARSQAHRAALRQPGAPLEWSPPTPAHSLNVQVRKVPQLNR